MATHSALHQDLWYVEGNDPCYRRWIDLYPEDHAELMNWGAGLTPDRVISARLTEGTVTFVLLDEAKWLSGDCHDEVPTFERTFPCDLPPVWPNLSIDPPTTIRPRETR